ncbi:MAG TPA: hypothetical protein VF591_28595 [Pyrinomonadaceae bacterium]|jgi:hypothetical protein
MKSRRTTPAPHAAALAALAAALLVPPAPFARAQSRGGHPPRRPNSQSTLPRETRAPSIRERQLIMAEMEKEAAKPPADGRPALPLDQIAEDFERIQAVNNRMMAAVMRSDSPDYRLVSDSTAEIRKRAARLKSGLSLPEPEGGEPGKGDGYKSPADAAQLKAALLRLDRALMSFVKSPVFRNTDVFDAADGARAGRDLEEVIELSRLIGRDAERMSKGAGKQ